MKKEKDIYKKMNKVFNRSRILLQPIESGIKGIGIPDIFYRTFNCEGWIELKYISKFPIMKKSLIRIPFQPGQMNWIKKYRALNGNIFLFLYIENSLWIFRGFRIKEYYTENDLIKSACYKRLWNEIDWDGIYALLAASKSV